MVDYLIILFMGSKVSIDNANGDSIDLEANTNTALATLDNDFVNLSNYSLKNTYPIASKA